VAREGLQSLNTRLVEGAVEVPGAGANGTDTVEPIPTLGALSPRGGPVQDPVLT